MLDYAARTLLSLLTFDSDVLTLLNILFKSFFLSK